MEVKGKSISEEEEEQITQSLSPPSIKQNTPLQIYNMNYLPQVNVLQSQFTTPNLQHALNLRGQFGSS